MTHGTYKLEDLLAQRFNDVAASELGFDAINDAIQERQDWLNAQVEDQMGLFAESSTDMGRVWGGDAQYNMSEVDQNSEADAEKTTHGIDVFFPMRKFSVSTAWTADYLLNVSARELASTALGIQNAYKEALQEELAFAIYNKDNYSIVDKYASKLTLAVKCFLNADSVAIPSAPDGTSFTASSHTHYLGHGGALANDDVDAAIEHVMEHGLTKGVGIYVPFGLVSVLEGLASTKFSKNSSTMFTGIAGENVDRIDPNADLDNAYIGNWDGRIKVFTRSWAKAGMLSVVAAGAAQKPLVNRLHKNSAVRGLYRTVQYGQHPITAQSFDAYIGFGAYNRAAVAVLDCVNAAYTEPSLIR